MMKKTILVALAALLKRIDKQHGTHTPSTGLRRSVWALRNTR